MPDVVEHIIIIVQGLAFCFQFMTSVSFSVANNHCFRMMAHLLLPPESFKGFIHKKEGSLEIENLGLLNQVKIKRHGSAKKNS
jgi:hypothetical protein